MNQLLRTILLVVCVSFCVSEINGTAVEGELHTYEADQKLRITIKNYEGIMQEIWTAQSPHSQLVNITK